MSSMEKNIVGGSESLLSLFLGCRGVFLVLEGVLQSWTCYVGTGAEMGLPKREDTGPVPESVMALL